MFGMFKKQPIWLRFIEGTEGGQANPGGAAETVEKKAEASEEESASEPVDWEAKYRAMREHSRSWEQKAKANLEAAEKLKKLEDRDKTSEEKLTSRVQEVEAELASARAEAAKLRVASEFGLSAEDADLFLRGSEDEMRAQAEALASRTAKEKTQENPLQGQGSSGPSKASAEAWAKKLLGLSE